MTSRYPTPRAEEFLTRLEERLPGKTFRHVCGVADLMVRLVEHTNITLDQAVAAGLLHDYCKAMKPAELLEAVEELDVYVPESWMAVPALLHGPVGAAMVERDLNVTDEDVLDAIFWHTTGREKWTPLGLALYFADYSEVGRTRPGAARARELLDTEGYLPALRYAVLAKTDHVLSGESPDKQTARFAKWFFSQ